MAPSVFSNVKTQLAHTPKLSFGNQFKSLGDVISSEKVFLNAVFKESQEVRKANLALKEWGDSEGSDLSDVLGKLSGLLEELANAQARYSEHLASYRIYFKTLRAREERFAALKKQKDVLANTIESTDKKLQKMGPENKQLHTTRQRLADLRQEMVSMEHSVANEDAALAHFRRLTARNALQLKLGALCQFGEKTTIVGELGQLLLQEISLDKFEAGQMRPQYQGFDRTEQIRVEAYKCLDQVVFNSDAPPAGYEQNADTSFAHSRQASEQPDYRQHSEQPEPHQQHAADRRFSGEQHSQAPPMLPVQSEMSSLRVDVPTSAVESRDRSSIAYLATEENHGGSSTHYHPTENTHPQYVNPSYSNRSIPQPIPTAYQQQHANRPSTPVEVHTTNTPPPASPSLSQRNRPQMPRGEGALGSKHGFDLDPYRPASTPGVQSQPPSAAPPAAYTYSIGGRDVPGTSGGGKITAGAFNQQRRPQPSYNEYTPSGYTVPPPPPGPSPADVYRDSYRNSIYEGQEPEDHEPSENVGQTQALYITNKTPQIQQTNQFESYDHSRPEAPHQNGQEPSSPISQLPPYQSSSLSSQTRYNQPQAPAVSTPQPYIPPSNSQQSSGGGRGFSRNQFVTQLD